jgi:hypothetical protein
MSSAGTLGEMTGKLGTGFVFDLQITAFGLIALQNLLERSQAALDLRRVV